MSTQPASAPTESSAPIGLVSGKQLTEILIRHNGLHEGLFDLSIGFNISVGTFGIAAEQQLPGVLAGVTGFGLARTSVKGALTVDAAEVNPAPGSTATAKTQRKRSKKGLDKP